MSSYPRYAIYYVPAQDSPFYRRAAALLGYDAYRGDRVVFADEVVDAVPDWHELTRDPRKYGFHATLKAPFALAAGKTEADLVGAVETFARKSHTIPMFAPVVSTIGDFIAIVPAERSVELEDLAQDCVCSFDHFRAPLTAADRARRNPDTLTARQNDYLDRWGYPYVMDDFRFHMTLTGRLSIEQRRAALAILQRLPLLEFSMLAIDRIALCRQSSRDAFFQVLTHHRLRDVS